MCFFLMGKNLLTLILPGGGSTDPPDFVLHFIQNNAQQTPPINL